MAIAKAKKTLGFTLSYLYTTTYPEPNAGYTALKLNALAGADCRRPHDLDEVAGALKPLGAS